MLEVFANAGLNLTRIESIPNLSGNFVFFLDFMGSQNNKDVLQTLEQVKSITSNFKLLGCYKEKVVE